MKLPFARSALAAVIFIVGSAYAADLQLADPSKPDSQAILGLTDCQVTSVRNSSGPAWRVTTGQREPWPGVTIKAAGRWDLTPFAQVVSATGGHTPPTAWTTDADPFFPLIDTLGQYRHRDWRGKTPGPSSLAPQRQAEADSLAARPDFQGWNRYGGWAAGPQLKSTGFFRVEKHEGKWWLVDLEGRLFWSHGIDCVRMLDEENYQIGFVDIADTPYAEIVLASQGVAQGMYALRSQKESR